MIAYFRYAGCPVCNYRVHELIENYDKIQSKGYNIIAVFESDNKVLKDYLIETPILFLVIGDPKFALYKKYAVEKPFWKILRSA